MKRFLSALVLALLLFSSPAFALDIKAGSYTGNGSDNRGITGIGFQPTFVLIRALTGSQVAVFRTSDMAGDNSLKMTGTALEANIVQSLDADGFTIGTDNTVNINAITYSYIAIKQDSTYFKNGTYTGDGTDNRSITGLGFQPDFCIVKHPSGSWNEPAWSSSSMTVGNSLAPTDGSFSDITDRIQAFEAGGFQIGTQAQVNNSGDTYYYFCGKNLANGIKSGTYTGTGTDGRNITGVGFNPESVWIQSNTTYLGQYWPGDTGDSTYKWYLAGQFTDSIQSLISDGFQLGTGYNGNGTVFYYVAFLSISGGGSPTPAAVNSYINSTAVINDAVIN